MAICTPTDVARVHYTQELLQKIADRLSKDPDHFDINEFLPLFVVKFDTYTGRLFSIYSFRYYEGS